ncbi:MAG: ADOP family duplicated permease [Gemmatimonadales bacterium]
MPRAGGGSRGHRKLFRLGRDETPEREMDEELETHLELRVADLIRQGVAEAEARRLARERFGPDFDAARRELRRGARRRAQVKSRWARLEGLLADLRLAIRRARQAPGFTAIAVAILALGLGATTAAFTLTRSILLKPLPFPAPDELVWLSGVDSSGAKIEVVSAGNWHDWRAGSRSLSSTGLFQPRRYAIDGPAGPVRVPAADVSVGFFETLEPRFLRGRGFSETEIEALEPVAVVSERLWRRLFGEDSSPARSVEIEHRPHRVVGVVRTGQEFPMGTELWLPVRLRPEHGSMRNNINWMAVARLTPDATIARAESELTGIAQAIRAAEPEAIYSYGVRVDPLIATVVGDAGSYLGILMAAVALVLLVACSSLAGAHLARGQGRRREMAVRAALGAGRSRLGTQVAVEHGVLSLAGGALGLLLAWLVVGLAVRQLGATIPRVEEVRIDGTVVAFALALAVAVGLLTSLAPIRLATGAASAEAGRGGRGLVGGGRGLPGGRLLALEVALALVLLAGAGLLIRSFAALASRELGFDPNVATASATLTGDRYRDSTAITAYWDRLVAELRGIPGVDAAGAANWVPLGMSGKSFVEVERGAGSCTDLGYRVITEGYPEALGIPLLAGRPFGPGDGPFDERVVLINQAAARECWPGEYPIGRRVRAPSFEGWLHGGVAPWLTVVGIIGDVRHYGPGFDAEAEMYVLHRQIPRLATAMTAIARGRMRASTLAAAVTERARLVDPATAVEVGTLDASLSAQLSTRTTLMTLVSGFGLFALGLTAVGLYGLLAYSVGQRTRELAVRAALGASRGALVREVVAAGARVVIAGVALGLVAAAGLTRYLASQLVEVTPLDPPSFAGALGVLLLVALAAIAIPALCGTRLDPAVALRAE